MSEKPRSNILCVLAGRTSTDSIIEKLFKEIAKYNKANVRTVEAAEVERDDIKWANAVLLVRGANFFMAQISIAAKAANRHVIVYLDDDLLSLYNEQTIEGDSLIKCLNNCDVFWVSNKNVGSKYSGYLNNEAKIVNVPVVEPCDSCREYSVGDKVSIVYAGSPSHKANVLKFIVPAFERVYSEYHNIRLYIVGFKDDSLDSDRIITSDWFSNVDDYRKYIDKIKPQIGIAVISDDFFSSCKFYNKYLEYSRLGIMGIYSNVEPYKWVVKHRENGLLVDNTVEAWTEAIKEAVRDLHLQEKCVINSQNNLREHFFTEQVIKTILSNIPVLVDEDGAQINKIVRYSRKMSYIKLLLRIRRK